MWPARPRSGHLMGSGFARVFLFAFPPDIFTGAINLIDAHWFNGPLATSSRRHPSSASLSHCKTPRLPRDVVHRVIHALLILSDAFNWTVVAKRDARMFARALLKISLVNKEDVPPRSSDSLLSGDGLLVTRKNFTLREFFPPRADDVTCARIYRLFYYVK